MLCILLIRKIGSKQNFSLDPSITKLVVCQSADSTSLITNVTGPRPNPILEWHRRPSFLAHLFQNLERGSRSLSGDSGAGRPSPAAVLSSHSPQRCHSVPPAVFRDGLHGPPRGALSRALAS